MTADEWAGHEYQRQRRRRGCGHKASTVLAALLAAVLIVRKGRAR